MVQRQSANVFSLYLAYQDVPKCVVEGDQSQNTLQQGKMYLKSTGNQIYEAGLIVYDSAQHGIPKRKLLEIQPVLFYP